MPPLKYFVPNSFTALSLLIGLGSVSLSAKGNFDLAAWMILWAALLDKLDGTAARLCNATSEFGVQFDSFADFVGFGIAPAALVYYRMLATGLYVGLYEGLLMVSCGVYVIALALRLARFNVAAAVDAKPGVDKVFVGIPGTLIGALIGAGYLTWTKYHLPIELLKFAPAYLVIFAALMVSSLRLPKLVVRKNRAMNVFQFGNIACAYIMGPLMLFPEYLFSLAVVYTVGGVTWCLLHPAREEPEQDQVEQTA